MRLRSIEIGPLPDGPVPDEVEALIVDAEARYEAMFANVDVHTPFEFVPSDARLVYRGLRRILEIDGGAGRFCDWGSGLGTIPALAGLLGFESHGIEIAPRLVEASRDFLASRGIEGRIHPGSFVPDDYAEPRGLGDPDFEGMRTGTAAYEAMGLDPEDFDLVFAFPWPGTEAITLDVFRRYAATGALLLTYHGLEGLRLHRKVARHRARSREERRR